MSKDGVTAAGIQKILRRPFGPEDFSINKKRRLPTLPRVCSTIGVSGLNCSVRNGKRWNPAAIATWITVDNISKQDSNQSRCIKNTHNSKYTSHLRRLIKRKSRAISNARLWRHRLYTCILSTLSSATTLKGDLILWPASRLDAFSAYPIPTRIPGGAPGGTTGKPEVSPTRSSRTSVRATQISCAHDR